METLIGVDLGNKPSRPKQSEPLMGQNPSEAFLTEIKQSGNEIPSGPEETSMEEALMGKPSEATLTKLLMDELPSGVLLTESKRSDSVIPSGGAEGLPSNPRSDKARGPPCHQRYPWLAKPVTRSQDLEVRDARNKEPLAQTEVKAGARPEALTQSERRERRDTSGNSRGAHAQQPSLDSVEQEAGSPIPMAELDDDRLEQFFKEQLPETWSDEAIATLQDLDPDLRKVRRWFKLGRRPEWDEVAKESVLVKTWWARYAQMMLSQNNVLYLRWESSRPLEPPRYRVVAVASMFKAILAELHDAKTAGHLGQKKTLARMRNCPFYWPGMGSFARRWVQNCVVCASRKNPKYSKRTPLQGYRVGSSMDRISIDLTGPFHPRTRRGNSIILTITDQFTRWVEAFPLKDGKAPEIARQVVEFTCRYGMPLEIHSDQGRNVDGEVMREVCRLLGTRKTHTTGYHPQGNAITERENSVIKAMLSAYVNTRLNDWDDHLPVVMLALRSSIHRTLGVSPCSMLLGREVRLPLDAFVGPPPEVAYECMPATEYAAALAEAMQQAHAVVSEHMDEVYDYQKRNYDRSVKAETYEVGQPVWLRVYPQVRGKSKSLMKPWDHGWVITAVLSDVNLKIQKTMKGKSMVVHSDRLKPFLGEVVDTETRKLRASVLGE